jgi:hypothetical protein
VAVHVFPKTRGPETAPEIATVAPARAPVAGGLWSEIKPAAGALLAADPLQQEADAVVADARSALGFLALNFLPAGVTVPAPAGAGPTPRGRTIGG